MKRWVLLVVSTALIAAPFLIGLGKKQNSNDPIKPQFPLSDNAVDAEASESPINPVTMPIFTETNIGKEVNDTHTVDSQVESDINELLDQDKDAQELTGTENTESQKADEDSEKHATDFNAGNDKESEKLDNEPVGQDKYGDEFKKTHNRKGVHDLTEHEKDIVSDGHTDIDTADNKSTELEEDTDANKNKDSDKVDEVNEESTKDDVSKDERWESGDFDNEINTSTEEENKELDINETEVLTENISSTEDEEETTYDNLDLSGEKDTTAAHAKFMNSSELSDMDRRRKRRPVQFLVRITVAAKGKAWVFQNARHLGDINHWNQVRTYKIRATRNDVIAIKSQGVHGRFGLVAVIRVDWPGRHKRYYVTGRTSNFKAVATHRSSQEDRRFWTRPGYSTCHWKSVRVMRTGRLFARRFPLKQFKARYVWARQENKGRQVLFRYKLTGERCKRPHSRFPKKCACKTVRTQTNAVCYQFTNHKMYKTINRNGRCRKRNCAPTYQCVFGQRKPRMICVRRFATSEVKTVGRVFNRLCRNVRIHRKPFYVPYQ